jgi:hypothetical protein
MIGAPTFKHHVLVLTASGLLATLVLNRLSTVNGSGVSFYNKYGQLIMDIYFPCLQLLSRLERQY